MTETKLLIHVSLAYLPPQLMKKILPVSPDLLQPTHINLSKSIWTHYAESFKKKRIF